MALFAFLVNIVTGTLVGYLALTNTLAENIENLFSSSNGPIVIEEKKTPASDEILEQLSNNLESSSEKVSYVLREHAGYQRAALLASKREEPAIVDTDTRPLPEIITDALVNIYCQYKTSEYIRTTTGTGFFINTKGIILTNAHVAQFLLLKETDGAVHDVNCVIRSGDPATAKYNAELLYISPTWIFDNANLITEESPRGTGERDYALLYISKAIDNTPLPSRFPAITVDTALLSRSVSGASVFTAGYPAEALMRGGADAKLTPVVAETTVGSLYTFKSNYADIFSISESPVGEQGASGGPIVTSDTENVIGLIVTKGDEETEGTHSLRALTLSYIDRTIIEETGFSLAQNMLGDVALRGNVFKNAMVPFLAGILEEELSATE